MKKRIASVAVVAVMGAGAVLAESPANALYGTPVPTSVAASPQTVNTIIANAGTIGPKRAAKLIKKLRQAKRAGIISERRLHRLVKRVRNHTR